jgi:hypothetical protein
VAIALLAIALWIPAFTSAKATMGLSEPVTPLFNLIDGLLGFSPTIQLIFAFLLLVLDTLIFNAVMVKHQLIGKVSTLGAFVFVLLMSLTRTQTCFYPFILSSIFILLIINEIYDVYLLSNPEMNLLKVGILVALSSMCYFPSIVLILWVMVALPIVKKGTLRLELIPLLGFLFTYFLYFVGVYLFGDFLKIVHAYQDYLLNVMLSVEGFNLLNIILLIFLIIISIVMLLGNSKLEKAFAVRVKITLCVLMMVVAVALLFCGGNVLMNGLIFIVLAILFAYEFTYMDNTGWANLVLTLFLLLVFANHYYFKLL